MKDSLFQWKQEVLYRKKDNLKTGLVKSNYQKKQPYNKLFNERIGSGEQ